MPRAQVFLLGAVWMCLPMTGIINAWSSPPHISSHLDIGSMVNFENEMRLDFDENNIEIFELERGLKEQANRFKMELIESIENEPLERYKRETYEVSVVDGIEPIPDFRITMNQSSAISCFLWGDHRICIFGEGLFFFNETRFLKLLSGFPTVTGDKIKTYVYRDNIYIAFYNKTALRLYFLPSPSDRTLKTIQYISAIKIEDCVFFEHAGDFYMALAIQVGPQQYAKDVDMQCVIYKWNGTTMDAIDQFPAPNLQNIVVFQQETTYIALVQPNNYVELWRIDKFIKKRKMIDKINIGLKKILQAEAFHVVNQWCILFASRRRTPIYCLQGNRLMKRQVLQHDLTNSPLSWSQFDSQTFPNHYNSTVLMFNSFPFRARGRKEIQNKITFYYSNFTGQFTVGSTKTLSRPNCVPVSLQPFLQESFLGYVIQACPGRPLEGYVVRLSAESGSKSPPVPLHREQKQEEEKEKKK